MRRGLQRLSRRSDEIAQNSNVRSVSPDAPGVHWQTKTLREVEVHACVVKLRQAKTLRGQHAIQASRIDRPRRAMTPPRAARQLVKLFPIAFVPGRHFMFDRETVNLFSNTLASTCWMHGRTIRFTSLLPHISFSGNNFDAYRPIHILHKQAGNPFSFPVVSNTLRDELFPETSQGRRSRSSS